MTPDPDDELVDFDEEVRWCARLAALVTAKWPAAERRGALRLLAILTRRGEPRV
jgi:hypothetical protein